jgi:hypothetical protein
MNKSEQARYNKLMDDMVEHKNLFDKMHQDKADLEFLMRDKITHNYIYPTDKITTKREVVEKELEFFMRLVHAYQMGKTSIKEMIDQEINTVCKSDNLSTIQAREFVEQLKEDNQKYDTDMLIVMKQNDITFDTDNPLSQSDC